MGVRVATISPRCGHDNLRRSPSTRFRPGFAITGHRFTSKTGRDAIDSEGTASVAAPSPQAHIAEHRVSIATVRSPIHAFAIRPHRNRRADRRERPGPPSGFAQTPICVGRVGANARHGSLPSSRIRSPVDGHRLAVRAPPGRGARNTQGQRRCGRPPSGVVDRCG